MDSLERLSTWTTDWSGRADLVKLVHIQPPLENRYIGGEEITDLSRSQDGKAIESLYVLICKRISTKGE